MDYCTYTTPDNEHIRKRITSLIFKSLVNLICELSSDFVLLQRHEIIILVSISIFFMMYVGFYISHYTQERVISLLN